MKKKNLYKIGNFEPYPHHIIASSIDEALKKWRKFQHESGVKKGFDPSSITLACHASKLIV